MKVVIVRKIIIFLNKNKYREINQNATRKIKKFI